jgi:hypothetical protein
MSSASTSERQAGAAPERGNDRQLTDPLQILDDLAATVVQQGGWPQFMPWGSRPDTILGACVADLRFCACQDQRLPLDARRGRWRDAERAGFDVL